LNHFLIGDLHKVISFISGFASEVPDRSYIRNELGDGRVLIAAPSLTKQTDGYNLLCPVAPGFPRIDAQKLGSDLARHCATWRGLIVSQSSCQTRVRIELSIQTDRDE
jgi:hypothetical protein